MSAPGRRGGPVALWPCRLGPSEASGMTGQPPRPDTRVPPGRLCTLSDHFAVWFIPNCGCAEYEKWAGGVHVTGDLASRGAQPDGTSDISVK